MPYIGVLQKYTEFSGRAARREFWGFTVVQFVLLAIAVVVDEVLFPDQSEWRGGPITAIFLVLTIMPWVCVWARRLQDREDSGFLQLMFWAPLAAFIILDRILGVQFILSIVFLALSGIVLGVLLFLCAMRGDQAANKYGPVPE